MLVGIVHDTVRRFTVRETQVVTDLMNYDGAETMVVPAIIC